MSDDLATLRCRRLVFLTVFKLATVAQPLWADFSRPGNFK